jgi:large subunit ribosomal protein L16
MRSNPKKRKIATRGNAVSFGKYGLRAETPGEISSNHIESVRRVLTRVVQKTGKIWIRIFPDMPLTKKPPEVTMGGGKGDPVGYIAPIKSGRILFEIDGVSETAAREALKKAGSKLPVKTKFVIRD